MFVSVSSSMMVEAEIVTSATSASESLSFISFVALSRVPGMLHMTSHNLWPWSGQALPSISAEGGPLSPYDQSYVVVERP